MNRMDSDSIDLIATDPPYGYGFMGKEWDKAVVGVDVWKEALRVLKPGAFAFVMAAPRQDVLSRMICNLADAGFETAFTSLYWTYATGFPKAMDVSMMIDKRECERLLAEKLGRKPTKDEIEKSWDSFREIIGIDEQKIRPNRKTAAKKLHGSYGGFQPKPAVEVIIVAMKPLSDKTYIDQALNNGKGVTWLDDGMIPFTSDADRESSRFGTAADIKRFMRPEDNIGPMGKNVISNEKGRFAPNLLVSDDVLNDGTNYPGAMAPVSGQHPSQKERGNTYGDYTMSRKSSEPRGDSGSYSRYFDLDRWWDEQLKNLPAAKTFPFFIVPKPDKKEKNFGCDMLEEKLSGGMSGTSDGSLLTGNGNVRNNKSKNNHPTVKPVKLISYLITIGSRPGDVVYEPFAGSGTTRLLQNSLRCSKMF